MVSYDVMSPSRSWVLGAAVVIIAVGFGALFSLSVFFIPIAEATKWNRAAISTVALLNWLALGAGSFVWGGLSDRFGARSIALVGGFVLGFGLVASSQVVSLPWFYVTFGLMVGFAVGAFYVPLNATIATWFEHRRGLALAVLSAGLGVGVFLSAPFTRWLISLSGWRTAMLVLGDIAWLVVIPAAMLLHKSPSPNTNIPPRDLFRDTVVEEPSSFSSIMMNPTLWALAVAHLACCAAHSGPLFHMVAHVTDQGISMTTAAAVYGVSGFASIAGRLACGALADRFGAKRTLITGLALQAAIIATYLIVKDLAGFYVVAILFGIAYGGVMPLYALLTREYFGERAMGTAFGVVFMVSCIGMGLGSFGGGWAYDRFGNYASLYAASFIVAAVAIVVASMCPRSPGGRPFFVS
jgi:MFS family permease